MSIANPFPLNIVPKVNSPDLIASLQQFGHQAYADADDINKLLDALQFLYEILGSPGGSSALTPFYRKLIYVDTPIFDLGIDVIPMSVFLNQGRSLDFGTEWTMVGSVFTSLYTDHNPDDTISISGFLGTMPQINQSGIFGEEFQTEFE